MSSCESQNQPQAKALIEQASHLVHNTTGMENHNGAEVANRLLQAGVEDEAVLAAAALGDLPYSVHTLHSQVEISMSCPHLPFLQQ